MRLADSKGILDVDEMAAQMTVGQFDEWLGFHLLEPSGGAADDERFARLTKHVAGDGHGTDRFRLAWRPPRKPGPMTKEEIRQQIRDSQR